MVSRQNTRRDFFLIVLASASWGTVGVANRWLYSLGETNALSLSFLRLAIAVPVFLAAGWIILRRRLFVIQRRDLAVMILMGCLIALSQALYIAAIASVGVSISTLISICAAPVIVALLSAFISRHRPSLMTLAALAAAIGGTALLMTTPSHPSPDGSFSHLGVLLAFLSAIGYAGFIFCGRLLTGACHPIQVSTVSFLSGSLLLLVCAASTRLVLAYTPTGWLILLFLGLIPTALGYGLFQVGIRSLPATLASIITMCEPLTAALLAWLFFDERLDSTGLLGAVLLLSAMAFIILVPRRYFE